MVSVFDDVDDLINKVNNNNNNNNRSQTDAEVETYADTSKQQNKYSELELELTPELKQAGIVERFAFYAETNAIQVLLNHRYNSKSIVFSVDKKDWNNTHDIFEKLLKQRGISKEHIGLALRHP